MRIASLCLLTLSLVASEAQPMPAGTEIATDFRCSERNAAENLIDGDPTTMMGGDGGTAKQPAHVFLAFPAPVPQLAGVATGSADAHGNYYAKRLEFWADTKGDGTFDVFAGSVSGLGAGEQGKATHIFPQPIGNVHHLLMRVVEQNMGGLKRSFFMSELELITDAGGAAPTAGSAPFLATAPPPLQRKPRPVIVDRMGTPATLLDAGTAWRIINAEKNKQSSQAQKKGAAPTGRLTWQSGAAPFMELSAPSRPFLQAFAAGVRIEVSVDRSAAPELRTWGIRCLDAEGETWHFSGDLPADGNEVTGSLVLDPHAAQTRNYGGDDAGRGVIDLPLRFSTLMFKLPEAPTEARTIVLGPLVRNEVDADQIEPELPLMAVKTAVRTDGELNLFSVGQAAQAVLELHLDEGMPAVECDVQIVATSYDGTVRTIRAEAVRITPETPAVVAFGSALDRLGWWELKPVLMVKGGQGRVAKPSIQVGRIEPAGTRPKPPVDDFWFGIDARFTPDNAVRYADAMQMIGVDIVREGVTWPRVEKEPGVFDWHMHDFYLKTLNERGMYGQYGLSFTPKWAATPEAVELIKKEKAAEHLISRAPPRLDAWRTYVRTAMEHIQREGLKIQFIEVWNEPDLFGFWRGTTEEYLDLVRAAAEEVRAVDPSLQVMTGGFAVISGHGGHARNPKLIPRTVVELHDVYDVLNIHEHGAFRTYQTRVDGGWAALRAQVQPAKPLYLNETGALFDKPEGRLLQAQELVKKFAHARTRGAVGFNWFCLNFFGHEHGYSMITRDEQPYPVLPAYNAMVHLMRGKRPQPQIPAGPGNWAFRFDGDIDSLLVGWSEDAPSPRTLLPVAIPAGATAVLVDVMGNEHPIAAHQGIVAWPLEREVHYLLVRGGKPTTSAPLALFGDEPYGEPGKEIPIEVTLANPLAQPVTVELTWTAPGEPRTEQAEIAPHATTTVRSSVAMPRMAAGEQPQIALTFAVSDTPWHGSLVLPMHAARVIPAGGINDREPDYVLADEAHIFNVNQADPNRVQYTWKGPADISATVWLAATDEGLELRIDARDDIHLQPNTAQAMWKADSVQFGIRIPGVGGRWEFGLGRADDGSPMVACFGNPVGASATYAEHIRLTVVPFAGGLSYRVVLPYAGLHLDRALLRSRAIGFNLIVNDDDGGGREGWAFLAPGMGNSNKPDSWPLICFE